MSIIWRKRICSYGVITIGTFLMGVATNIIYEPMSMVTGGFSGVGIILHALFRIPVWITTVLLNIPLFLLARKTHGKHFLIQSLFAMLSFSLTLAFVPIVSIAEKDYLMAALLGGALHGVGLGLVFSTGSSTGGTDLLSALLHPVFPVMRVANILGIIDGIIVVSGMMLFGIKNALYAMVAVFVTSKIMDGVTAGMRYAKVLYIISDESVEIAKLVMDKLQRGVTALKGNGMYSGEEKQILMCVVSRREAVSMVKYIKEADARAFVIISDAREVMGEGFESGEGV